MDARRTAAIDRVRKLAEMTVENGCTEAEQDTATKLAQRLIERHQLTFFEVAGVEPEPKPVPWTPPPGFHAVPFGWTTGTATAQPYFNAGGVRIFIHYT